MNNELFDQANERYRLRDYRGALMAFTECLQDTNCPLAPGEMGLLYHQIGNCLVKLKNPTEAIHAYTQATADPAYSAIGTVECNLGMAYASLRDYDNAIHCFEKSVADAANPTPYKSYMGMGNALMKLGKSAEAGVAFREAALDESNPDPTKALLNLGVCFMALNRPADAVASYESALQFDMQPATRNKLQASLGQAYVACGQMEKAVHAFEEAIADKTYFLSDSASVDYQRAVGAVAQGTSEQNQATQVLQLADMSGLDVAADGLAVYDEGVFEGDGSEAFYYDEGAYEADPASFPGYVGAYENVDNDRFFTATDAELEQWSRGLAKQDRKRRDGGLKSLLFFVVLIVLAAAAGVFAYTQGYGYPTVQTVTQELFSDPAAAADTVFSADVDKEAIPGMLDPVVTDPNVTVDGVSRSMTESTVYATATTEGGGSVQYRVSMVRDGITWKVSNVELYFPSQA